MPTTPPLLCLALAVVIAVGCQSAPAADPPKLTDLLTEYKELGLPLPPAKAKLVRYEFGGRAIVDGKLQPPNHSLAFELQPGTKKEGPLLLEGAREYRVSGGLKTDEVKPEAVAAEGIDIDPDTALAVAAQCHDRGWDALAKAVLERSQPKQGTETPSDRLVHMAWRYWVGRLTHPTADRTPIAKRLKELMKRDPKLDTEDHRSLLKSLELALVPGKGKPGSMEALIDALVDYGKNTGTIGIYEPGDAYWRIAEKGFDAVPALIAALGDDRLTRSEMVGFNNFRSWNLRVGDVVADILEGLAGEELDRGTDEENVGGGWLRRQQGFRVMTDSAKKWWATAEKVGEERYLLDRVLPPAVKGADGVHVNEHLLRLVTVKYPTRVPELYRTVLEKRPEVWSGPLAEAVAKSRIPAKDKRDLLELGGKHKELEHRVAALWELKGVDAKLFDALLLPTVEGLPKDVDQEYWCCQEGAVPRLAVMSDNPKVWAALEAAIKRASLGLRMELLHELNDSDEPRRRADRLRLLAAHLDDTEVRDVKEDMRFGGPGAGFPYDRITAGDAAALDLAQMVGVEVPWKLDLTTAEWTEVREKVRKAVKAELDKAK